MRQDLTETEFWRIERNPMQASASLKPQDGQEYEWQLQRLPSSPRFTARDSSGLEVPRIIAALTGC